MAVASADAAGDDALMRRIVMGQTLPTHASPPQRRFRLLNDQVCSSLGIVPGSSALHVAAQTGDAKAVRNLLELGVNPLVCDAESNTALETVMIMGEGSVDVVNLLIAAGSLTTRLDEVTRLLRALNEESDVLAAVGRAVSKAREDGVTAAALDASARLGITPPHRLLRAWGKSLRFQLIGWRWTHTARQLE